MKPTDRVLQFIMEAQWRDLPSAVQHQAKRCLLDTLGALVAGVSTPVARMMCELALDQFRGDEATILVDGSRASAVGAALANGFAANGLDIDDGYRLVKGHPGACVLPALLAGCEMGPQRSGEDFLTALVVGYEVGIRAGLIRHAVYQCYHASGSWGALAGAAAAGKLLGLDGPVLRQALGTAEYHAPIAPMMKGIDTPCMGKDGIGWGGMVAVSSLLMARKGFTGVEPLFNESPRPEWIQELGDRYECLNLYIKPYAACRWAQPAVNGVLRIVRGHGLRPEDLNRIVVRTFSAAAQLSRSHPRDTEEAQYNLSFPVAAALMDGEVGPRQVLPPRIHDEALLALADRLEVEVEEAFDKAFPAKAYAEVIVETRRGETLSSGTVEASWEPPDTLPSDGELEAKFRWLVEPVLGLSRTQELVSMIWKFEETDDARRLIDACTKPKAV